MIYNIYTDGSCRNNGYANAVGAWGYVILNEDQTDILAQECGRCEQTTNQRMELTAIIKACETIASRVDDEDEIHIYTDSSYACNCYLQKWYRKWQISGWVNSKKESVANRDLWELLIPFYVDPIYHLHKVTGHMDNKWNNYVDKQVQTLSLGG